MEKFCNFLHGLKPTLFMLVVQFVFAGVNVFYKLAANDGMSLRVIIAYRFVFATGFMIPLALFFERESRYKITWTVLFQAFLCGLFGGSMAQNLYLESLVLTSATFAAAMGNLVPAMTFIMSICFGLEKLGLRSLVGKAKVMGTLIGIGGAMVLTLYKGAEINIWSTNVDLLQNSQHHGGHVPSSHGSFVLGSLLAIASCFTFALWLIIQAKMMVRYPYPYSSTALICIMGTIQSIVFTLCTEKDWNQWKLGWNIRLLTVAYSGIGASGLMITLISWCVRARGPLFVSIFSPLTLVLVAILGSLILDEKLHVGSIIGATLIVCGLYVVLWGKNKEMKKMNQLVPSESTCEAETINIVITSSRGDTSNDNNSMNNNNNSKNIAQIELLDKKEIKEYDTETGEKKTED